MSDVHEEADQVATIARHAEAQRILADAVQRYFELLTERGFSRLEALALCTDYQRLLLGKAPRA